jgi:uncharacterized protein
MGADRGLKMDLRNETAINVAGLLKGSFGDRRRYAIDLDRFPLDEGLVAEDTMGEVRLTRLRDAVMATVDVAGRVALECSRCLRRYAQPFATSFSEEYRQSVDLRSGVELPPAEDEDAETALIDENHELDLAEVLRQEILVALPMRPDCGEECPGPAVLGAEVELGATKAIEDRADGRFAALAGLLDDDNDDGR